MAFAHVIAEVKGLSLAAKIGAAAGVIAVFVVIGLAVRTHHRGIEAKLREDSITLKQENQKTTDLYNQKTGEAHASELAAKEEKAKADAVVATIDAHAVNVKALDTKLDQVNKNYEKAKTELGDCADTDDCLRKLCAELAAAGFKTKGCPD